MSIRAKLVIGDFDGGITDGTIPFSYISTASTNRILVKRGQGCLASIFAVNASASIRYLKFYDTNRTPDAAGVGTPIRRFAIPASATGKGLVISPKLPFQFYRGLAFTITGGADDTDTTAIADNDVILTLECAPGVPDGVPVTAYSTTFPTVENPISQGSIWQRGLTEGSVWNNPQVTANGAVAAVSAGLGATRYDDDIAHLKKTYTDFGDNHYAQGTAYVASGYTGNGGSHEIELLLRFQITANSARGYEVIYGMGPLGGYMSVVRWNGPLGDFTALYDPGGGSYPVPVNGDIIRAEIVGTNILVYRNGTLVQTVGTLGTWTEGQPGIGFWPIDGAVTTSFGWRSFQTGNL